MASIAAPGSAFTVEEGFVKLLGADSVSTVAVRSRFGQMLDADRVGIVEIRQRARDLQNSMAGAR